MLNAFVCCYFVFQILRKECVFDFLRLFVVLFCFWRYPPGMNAFSSPISATKSQPFNSLNAERVCCIIFFSKVYLRNVFLIFFPFRISATKSRPNANRGTTTISCTFTAKQYPLPFFHLCDSVVLLSPDYPLRPSSFFVA